MGHLDLQNHSLNQDRASRFGWIFIGLNFCLLFVYFAPHINDFIYIVGSDFSDLTIAHLPNLVYLRNALVEYRTVPLWSPAILGGFPFFANPLSGMWYPPGWPAVVFPEPWMFNLLAGFHLVFGAYGMIRFLKELGLRKEAQLIGGLAFGLMPKLLSHYAAGHITLVYAVVWTPWLLLTEIAPPRSWIRPGVLLAVIFLADPRWAAYAAVLWLAYSIVRKADIRVWIRHTAVEAVSALLLSAPLLLPLAEFTRLSTRAALTSEETLAFSLPPIRLFTLLFPLTNAEWQLYPGIITLIFAGGALVQPAVRKRAVFWLAAAIFALLFALGDAIPILRLWASLPIAGLLRVPVRSLFVFGLACCVLSGYGIDAVFDSAVTSRSRFAWNLLIAGVAGIFVAFAFILPPTRYEIIWTSVITLLLVCVCWLVINQRFKNTSALRVLLACIYLELVLVSAIVGWPRSRTEVEAEGNAAGSWLSEQPGSFRVYSPSYSIPQHTAARYGLELANGVDPLQLQTYADFMAKATGVPNTGYSIPLPPIDGDPATANRGAIPDTDLLAWLNVRYVAAEYDLTVVGLEPVRQSGETRIYENTRPPGAVWRLPPGGEPEPVQPAQFDRSPNRIDLRLAEPGVYFISEIDYPGWRLEGAERLPPYRDVFRTFEVIEAGEQISYIFRPVSLYAGIGLFLIGILLVMVRRNAITR